MRIRFIHAKLLPLSGESAPFDGELATEDDRIVYAGAPRETHAPFERTVDCGGDLLLPGFKNAHAHAGMTFLRSLADDLPLDRWLNEQVFPHEARLSPEDIYWLTRLAILEYLSGGITASFDMYYFRDEVARASIDAGFRTVIMDGANDYGGSARRSEQEYERFSRLHPLIGYRLGVHAEYTTSLTMLKDFAGLVQSLKQPIWAHMNETAAEVEGCVARHGMRPFELFDSLGLFNYGGGGFHCIHLSEHEKEIMAARGLYAVVCPASNLKLGSGISDVTSLIARGIPVALGTDGAGSNNALSLLREMYLVTALQKLQHGPAALPAPEVLKMACQTGAHAMGLNNCDALAPGKQADLVRIRLDRPNMQPVNDPLKNLVYSGDNANVRMTMIAGHILYEDGTFPGCDPAEIYQKANAITRRITRA